MYQFFKSVVWLFYLNVKKPHKPSSLELSKWVFYIFFSDFADLIDKDNLINYTSKVVASVTCIICFKYLPCYID